MPIDAITPEPVIPSALLRAKYRVRFQKTADLRFVSHHDLMHIFERLFRRADFSIPTSQGFNPRPRIWFALSLALGVAGLNEVFEFELIAPLPEAEVRVRIIQHAPPGLIFLSVCEIDVKLSARVRRVFCRFVPESKPADDLSEVCAAFMQKSESWVERLRPQHRRVNIRPFVEELRAVGDTIEMSLWITPYGAARADEVINALGLAAALDAGGLIERTDLEIYDELPPDRATPPPVITSNAPVEDYADTSPSPSPSPRERIRPPTAIIDNPLSFET